MVLREEFWTLLLLLQVGYGTFDVVAQIKACGDVLWGFGSLFW